MNYKRKRERKRPHFYRMNAKIVVKKLQFMNSKCKKIFRGGQLAKNEPGFTGC